MLDHDHDELNHDPEELDHDHDDLNLDHEKLDHDHEEIGHLKNGHSASLVCHRVAQPDGRNVVIVTLCCVALSS